MKHPVDISGKRFGRLVAVAYMPKALSTGRKMSAWKMLCDCGNEVVAMTSNLNAGKHRTCGHECPYHKEDREPAETRRPEYRVYRQMIDRCELRSASNYQWYGGRGISVCRRWRRGENGKTGFQCFIADMGDRPDGLTLERVDGDGDYEPANCKWATWAEQAANRSDNHRVSAFGRNLTIAEWADHSGVPSSVISDRLARGWPSDQAVSAPISETWSRHRGERVYLQGRRA